MCSSVGASSGVPNRTVRHHTACRRTALGDLGSMRLRLESEMRPWKPSRLLHGQQSAGWHTQHFSKRGATCLQGVHLHSHCKGRVGQPTHVCIMPHHHRRSAVSRAELQQPGHCLLTIQHLHADTQASMGTSTQQHCAQCQSRVCMSRFTTQLQAGKPRWGVSLIYSTHLCEHQLTRL